MVALTAPQPTAFRGTLEAMTHLPSPPSDGDIAALSLRGLRLIAEMKQHYWRHYAEWAPHRQAEAARLLIDVHRALHEVEDAALRGRPRRVAAAFARASNLFTRAAQTMRFEADRL